MIYLLLHKKVSLMFRQLYANTQLDFESSLTKLEGGWSTVINSKGRLAFHQLLNCWTNNWNNWQTESIFNQIRRGNLVPGYFFRRKKIRSVSSVFNCSASYSISITVCCLLLFFYLYRPYSMVCVIFLTKEVLLKDVFDVNYLCCLCLI